MEPLRDNVFQERAAWPVRKVQLTESKAIKALKVAIPKAYS